MKRTASWTMLHRQNALQEDWDTMTTHHVQLHTDEPALPQREERRPSDLRGWFTRTDDGSGCDFAIINLSYGGCQLRTGAQLQVGEQVSWSVVRRGVIEAEVEWRCGDLYGLAFAVVQPAKPHSPREVERHKATINVLVRRQGRTSQQLEASDVSRLGCCLKFVDAPRQGDRLWVQLPCLEPIETDVRWVEGSKAGVAFTKPIHPAVFDFLLEAWTSQIN